MVIRCKSCYKILHHQERYCTRCGFESEEVVEIMTQGTREISEWQKTKVALVISFFVCFLLTGVFSVVMGILYRRFNPDLIIDKSGMLPLILSGFSRSYSLFITGIASFLILSIVFYQYWLSDYDNYHLKDGLYALGLGTGLILVILTLYKTINLDVIPNYFYLYLAHEVVPFSIILIVLFLYSLVEEFLRKIVLEGVTEVTIWPNLITVLISGIFSVLFNLMVFMDFNSLIVSFILGVILGHLYLKNIDNLFPSIIIRIILITIVLFI